VGRHGVAAAAAVALVVLLCGVPAGAQTAGRARVQYVSSGSIYLDAGQADGLFEGMRVRVERDGRVLAELEVQFAAQHSAACKIVSGSEPLRPGDPCRFAPGAAPAPPAAAPPPATAAAPASRPGAWARFARVDGRVMSLYAQSSGPGGVYRNPSLRGDLRWSGAGREQLGVRFRGDRPRFDADVGPGTLDRRSSVRVYELQARYRSHGQRLEMEAGRLLAPRLELLGYLDGGGARWRVGRGVTVGMAGGRGAELGRDGLVTGGSKLGGYVEGSWASGARRARTLLGVGTVRDAELVRRQFGLVQSDLALGRRASLWQSLEIDVHPPWRRRLGEPHVELTAASITTHVQVSQRAALSLGVDTRRGLAQPEQRTLANLVLPERTQAAHAALSLRLGALWSARLGGDLRLLPGDARATSWDASLYGARLGARWLSGTLHVFGYQADLGRNLYGDVGLVARAGAHLQFDLAAGAGRIRTLAGEFGDGERLDETGWVRLGADLRLAHGLWLGASGERRAHGDGDELALELGRAF
jgi:hypothetical protein